MKIKQQPTIGELIENRSMSRSDPTSALRGVDLDLNEQLMKQFPASVGGGVVYRWNDVIGNGAERRDSGSMSVALDGGAAGGALVGTSVPTVGASIRDAMVLGKLGANFIGGLRSDVEIPYGLVQISGEWVLEGDAPTKSAPTLAPLALSPHRLCAYVVVTRQLQQQGAAALDTWLRAELFSALAHEIERAAINGSGVGAVPSGLLRATGATSVVGGVSGAAPTYANLVDLEAGAKISGGKFGFLCSRKVRQKLRKTFVNGTGSDPVWSQEDADLLLGHPAGVTDAMPDSLASGSSGAVCSAIAYGDLSECFVATWGPGIVVDTITNDATLAKNGTILVLGSVFADAGWRNPAALALMLDAIC